MSHVVAWSFASVVAVSLLSLLGLVMLSMDEARIRRLATFVISFAVGGLLGDAFIHLVPEAFRDRDAPLAPSLAILGGMLLFFVVEKLVRHRHGAQDDATREPDVLHSPLATMNVLGDTLHNFIDGVLIGASWLASPTLGASTALAVLLHEIPHELGDFAVLIHAGLGPRRAVLLNLATASAAIFGTALVLLVGAAIGAAATRVVLPVAAGGFVYVAAADLVPELQRQHGLRALLLQTLLITLGIGVMGLLALAG